MDGRTDGWIDRQPDKRVEGWINRRASETLQMMNGRTDEGVKKNKRDMDDGGGGGG